MTSAETEPAPSSSPSGRGLRAGVRTFATVAAAFTVAGVPLAGLWALIAPRAMYVLDGHGHAGLADVESPALMSADGWFALIMAVTGFIFAVAAYPLYGRVRPVAVLVGLAVGGTVSGLLAWLIGRSLWIGGYHHAVQAGAAGRQVRGYLTVHAHGALLMGAFFAVAAFGLIEALGGASRAPGRGAPAVRQSPVGPAGPFEPEGPTG